MVSMPYSRLPFLSFYMMVSPTTEEHLCSLNSFFFFTCHHMVTKLVNGGNCVYKHWTESPLKTHWSQRCRGIIQSSIRNPFKIRLLAVSVFISKTFGNQDSREMLNLKNWLYLSLFQLKGWVVVVEEPTFGTGKGLFNFIL